MRPSAALLPCLAASACVTDAPEDLETAMVYGFVHFDEHRQAAWTTETVDAIVPMSTTYDTELREGYRIDPLTVDDLSEVGIDAEVEAEVMGVSAKVDMTSSLDGFANAYSWPRMDEVIETTIGFRVDAEYGDRDCFLEHECDTYGLDAWRENDLSIFGTSQQTFRRDFVWAESSDGDLVLLVRDLVPDEAEISSGVIAIHQQYGFSLLFETDTGSTRMDAFWIDAEALTIDVPDAFALDFAVNTIGNTAADIDAFVDANDL